MVPIKGSSDHNTTTILAYGSNRIIQKIDHDALYLLGIEIQFRYIFICLKIKFDVFMCILKKNNGIHYDPIEIAENRVGNRKLRIAGKGIDQVFQHINLIYYCLGAFVKNGTIVTQPFSVFFLQSLGRELDRRQWILNLVGHSPGNLPPCRCSLGLTNLREIFKDDYHAHIIAVIIVYQRYRHQHCKYFASKH